jgi:hypothetical protein
LLLGRCLHREAKSKDYESCRESATLRGNNKVQTIQMPSAITAMPEQQFSYPPLGEMLETHPYALPEQRAFHQLANERDYTSELQAALDPKNEPPTEEPGRSKAVPKPDRPVMKDDNGRYVCNWPGCDEAVKDFGRKCEWS